MPALFPRASNTIFRVLLVLGAVVAVAIPIALMLYVRTPEATGQHHRPAQPIFFDHSLHTAQLEIDCRYCHAAVEHSSTAGMPATHLCVPCHDDSWLESTTFAPVRKSLKTGEPIPWQRVNSLPDFVFFNHSIHVAKGVGCETCHGRVDTMTTVRQAKPLTMRWCLGCHMEPGPHLRPREAMTVMGWKPEEPRSALAAELLGRYHVRRLTDCTICHR